jgi:hypothetical protein
MLTNTVSLGANTLWNNDDAWQFGRQANGTAYFPGYIDELRITVGQARYTSNFVTSNVPFSVSAGWNTNMVLYTTNMPAALAPSDILVQHDIQVVQTSTPFTVGRDLIVQATVNDDYTGWSNLAATVDSIGVPTNHVRVMAYNPIANPNSKSNMAIRTILATNDNAALRLNLYNSQYTYK